MTSALTEHLAASPDRSGEGPVEGRGQGGTSQAVAEPRADSPRAGGRRRARAAAGESPRHLVRRAAGAGAWTLAGRISAGLAAFGTSALAARMLTPAGMAGYALATSAAAVGGLVGGLGLSQVVVRFAASALALGDRPAAGRVVRRCLVLGCAGLVVTAVVYAVLAGRVLVDHLAGMLGGDLTATTDTPAGLAGVSVVLVAALLVALGAQTLVGECHRGLGDARRASVYGGPVASVLLLVALLALWVLGTRRLHPSELVTLAAATAAVSVAIGLGTLLPRLRRMGRHAAGSAQAAAVGTGRLLATSAPLLVSVLLYAAFTQVDLWVLGATRHGDDVAAYAVASRVASLVAMPALVVNGAVLPMIAELWAQGRHGRLFRLLRLGAGVSVVPAVGATALFWGCGAFLLGTVFGPVYRQGAVALVILAAGNVVAAWAGPAAQILAMCGRERALFGVSALTAATTVVAIVLLVPAGGPVAAALLAASGLAVQSVTLMLLVRRDIGGWVCAVAVRGDAAALLSARSRPGYPRRRVLARAWRAR